MSEEEAVQLALDAWNKGIDAFIERLAPDVEWHAPPGFPEGEIWHGREGLAPVLREQFGATLAGAQVMAERAERGPGGWMTTGRMSATQESGAVLEWAVFAVWQLGEDGLVERAWIFNDLESAERQAGFVE